MTRRAMSARPYPSALIRAHGYQIVKQRAAEGDREAQWSLGYKSLLEAGDMGTAMHVGMVDVGRSPMGDVGLELCTAQFPVAH